MSTVRSYLICLGVLALAAPAAGDGPMSETARGHSDFFFVNGGNTPTDNNPNYEEDLKVFYFLDLKAKRKWIYNAGGMGGPVVKTGKDGDVQRDEFGTAITEPSTLTIPSKPATKQNVLDGLQELAAASPARATLVWTDHGRSKEISLWGDTLSQETLRSYALQYSGPTLFRSIYLQCYGGSMMVDPYRKVPTERTAFLAFLQSHYPPNFCGFAESGADEPAYSWRDTRWMEDDLMYVFDREKQPSLRTLKDRYLLLAENQSSPRLTSDYFLRDVRYFLCTSPEEARKLAGYEERQCHGPDEPAVSSAATRLYEVRYALFRNLCENPVSKELNAAYADVEEKRNIRDEFEQIQIELVHDFLEAKEGEAYHRYELALWTLQDIADKFVEKGVQKAPSADALHLINDLKKEVAKYEAGIKKAGIRESDDFKGYLKSVGKAWMDQHKDKYPAFAKRFYSAGNAKFDFSVYKYDVAAKLKDAQEARRTVTIRYETSAAEFTEEWLELPGNEEIRKLRDAIDTCENSALN